MRNSGKTEECCYPRAYICTFCKQEFESIDSVFDHMRATHSITQGIE